MHIIEKISNFVGKMMAVIVLGLAALSLFLPASGLWISLSWVNYLLMVVMFGMGLTLRLEYFRLIFTRPKDILLGCAAQFIIMPALAFLLSRIFGLEPAHWSLLWLACTIFWATAAALGLERCSGSLCPKQRRFRLKSVCKTQAWHQALPPRPFPLLPWQRYQALFFLSGTIFPAPSLQTCICAGARSGRDWSAFSPAKAG